MGSPGNGLQYVQPPALNGADNLKIAPLDVSGPHIAPLGSSLDSKSSLGSFVPGSSLPSSAASYYTQASRACFQDDTVRVCVGIVSPKLCVRLMPV